MTASCLTVPSNMTTDTTEPLGTYHLATSVPSNTSISVNKATSRANCSPTKCAPAVIARMCGHKLPKPRRRTVSTCFSALGRAEKGQPAAERNEGVTVMAAKVAPPLEALEFEFVGTMLEGDPRPAKR
jgi:hypothetical protein